MKRLAEGSYRIVPGELYGTPKEIWGFSLHVAGTPLCATREFLKLHADLLGLEGVELVRRSAPIHSLGARHVILQQEHRGIRVHRAFVTAHVANDGQLYLVKNRAMPARLLGDEARFRISKSSAIAAARRSARAGASQTEIPVEGVERRWFPLRRKLIPAWRVRVRKLQPPIEDWIVHVNAENGKILSRWDNVALAEAIGCVFDPSPVIALGSHKRLKREGKIARPPRGTYRQVVLGGLTTKGYLDGKRVTTRLTPNRAEGPLGYFCYTHGEPGLAETMAYYHIDAAIAYLERLGYVGKRRIFAGPIAVNTRATKQDNSWYDPWSKTLSFGYGAIPDAEDAETILHELGHAIQDAICPDFGQSKQSAAMGEGFGDYLAASFFSDKKRGQYRVSVMCWDGIVFDELDPPCVRRIDAELGLRQYDDEGDEHDNGKIWSATLWDVFCALGDREVADKLIIESHFQLDPFTRMEAGARAILDADRNLYGGRHVERLRRVLKKRGFHEL
jgi:hypothetical protein